MTSSATVTNASGCSSCSRSVGTVCSDGAPQERRAGESLERGLASEHELEVEHCEPRVLTRDLLRTRTVPGAHRLEHRAVLVLRDDENLVLPRERRL